MHRCLGCMEEFEDGYEICPYCGYEIGTPPKEAYHMTPGTLLAGRYVIGCVLGFGGFGVTYIGWDTVLLRKVAVKEYLPGEFSTRIPGQTQITTYEGERSEQFDSGLGKFLEEAKMLAKMEAANGVVRIYNSFKENNTAYIIMEYLEGRTLKAYLEQHEKLSVEEAKEILHPIVTALKEVHAMGVMHRDIAPDNIFLTNDGKVKLLDFGASRFATTSHSKSLSVIIKPGYAPVEQYRSRGDQGPWTDVYSLAATFYKMVTGITPEDAMERVEKEELKKPSKLGVAISKNTEHAIMNALNIKIGDRTQDAESFEKELYGDEKVKLRFVRLKKADVGKWPLWAKLATSAAVLSVVVFAGLLATGVIDYSRLIPEGFALPAGMARVPNLVNEEVATADGMMTDAGLVMQIVDKQYSEYVPEDMVLSQNVDRGKIVKVDRVVEVVVSGGREIVIVPDVCGYQKDSAAEALLAIGLALEMKEEYGAFEAGVIMAQSLQAGEQAHRGDTVVLTVSLGLDTYLDEETEITIPDFTGMTLEQATVKASQLGLYLVKTGERTGTLPAGSILEQTPRAGAIGTQGTVVKIVTVAAPLPVYVSDVQYKDYEAAAAELEALGFQVSVAYEESSTVAAGKVIRQSLTAYTEAERGAAVLLTVSSGTAQGTGDTAAGGSNAGSSQAVESKPKPEWSEWMTSLPDGVTGSGYEIETKTQYSFRDKSVTTSDKKSLTGWTLYDTTVTQGEYGAWSTWSATKPAVQEGREIKEKVQYSYSDYETIKSDKKTLSGWKQIDVRTYYLEDYGSWSDWSTTAVSQSATRKVETKTQYRTRKKEWTTSSSASLAGYTYSHRTESAGEWSAWSRTPVSESTTESRTVKVETKQATEQVQTGSMTYYKYYHWYYWNTTANAMYYSYMQHPSGSGRTYDSRTLTSPLPLDQNIDGYDSFLYEGKRWYLEAQWTEPVYTSQTYTLYRSQTITYTYHHYKWSDWSGWTDNKPTADDNTEVGTRTMYRYADKLPHYEYTHERWTTYTAWSDTPAVSSTTRKVKTQTVYKYRDRTDVVTYHFYQWGAWSNWRDERVEASDTREVQQRTLYRYRPK